LTGNELTIKIGNKISSQVGYDYHKCISNPGDYYGNTTDSLKNDLTYSGYNDNQCLITQTSSYTLVYFSRYANTYDDFDNVITKKTKFCFTVGANENCYDIEGRILFPQMNV
jgi:hypothetical protein